MKRITYQSHVNDDVASEIVPYQIPSWRDAFLKEEPEISMDKDGFYFILTDSIHAHVKIRLEYFIYSHFNNNLTGSELIGFRNKNRFDPRPENLYIVKKKNNYPKFEDE